MRRGDTTRRGTRCFGRLSKSISAAIEAFRLGKASGAPESPFGLYERPLHHASHGPPPPLRRGGTEVAAVRDMDPPPVYGGSEGRARQVARPKDRRRRWRGRMAFMYDCSAWSHVTEPLARSLHGRHIFQQSEASYSSPALTIFSGDCASSIEPSAAAAPCSSRSIIVPASRPCPSAS